MFPYIGGKSHHVGWMDPLFPVGFTKYVEVFGGAGWVLVKSPKVAGAVERIYNDYNPLLANVWECFRADPSGLLRQMNATPKSDPERYKAYQRELFVDTGWHRDMALGNLDLATKYLYLQTQVFAGTPLSATNVPYFTETKAGGKYPSKWDTLRRKLEKPEILERLQKTTGVENLDCEDLIRKHDGDGVFFYADPPYWSKEFYYSKEFPREKHETLARTLGSIQGKFALSYYEFDDLRTLYPEDRFRWHRQSVYRSAATRSGNRSDYRQSSKGTEILIMNY